MTKIYSGTAGWSYKDWIGPFYPKAQSSNFDWLSFYSHYFNCVEVNSTYYTYLSPRVVEGWVRKVVDNDDFLFNIKLHQDFTHKKDYDKQKIKAFYDTLGILDKAERLGGLLIQFPYSFSFNDPNVNYVKELREIFQNYDCFLEVRHKSWLNKEALELFKKHDLVYTTIDQPQIGQSMPLELIVTNGKAYIRFHGRNKEAWIKSLNNFGKKQTYEEQSARYSYLYSAAELIEIQQVIQPLLKTIKVIYVIFNNHPKGEGVANAFEMTSMLENNIKVDIPKTTLSVYPRLSRIVQDENNFSLRP